MVEIINIDKLKKLVGHFMEKSYDASKEVSIDKEILSNCKQLLDLDYKTIEINNEKGQLSTSYPSTIIIPEHETDSTSTTQLDTKKLTNLITNGLQARYFSRFPVPVILYKNQFICRSSPLSNLKYKITPLKIFETEILEQQQDEQHQEEESFAANTWRRYDVKLLNLFNVKSIVDLMMDEKRELCGVSLACSERADTENLYRNFKILGAPYPDSICFNEFRKHEYKYDAIKSNWKPRSKCVACILPLNELNIKWSEYQEWNVVTLTLNYIRFILHSIDNGESDDGLLIHCSCGTDTTPLFISILRLSLWADGLIHKTLTPDQILYFTLAYDWYLFGYDLPKKLTKSIETIMFCFSILKEICNKDYSLVKIRKQDDIRLDSVQDSTKNWMGSCDEYCDSSTYVEGLFSANPNEKNENIIRCNSSASSSIKDTIHVDSVNNDKSPEKSLHEEDELLTAEQNHLKKRKQNLLEVSEKFLDRLYVPHIPKQRALSWHHF